MAHIHFKFKSSKRQDSVTFDGLSMSVADLKKAITEKMRSASTGSGKNEFDLEITNAQTKQVYYDMEEMIPKNSSVIVARMPIMTASSKLKIEQDRNSSSPKGHHDQLQDKEMSLAQLTQTPDLLNAKASEGDKIKAMMAQSTSDYDVSNYQRTRPVGPPPSYYKCYRCNQSGHYINNCPYKPDPGETQYKRSTGIPQSHLVTADSTTKGAYVTSTGQYVVPAVDAQAYKETKKTIVSKEEERFVPRELTCSMCKDLLTDAVVTPCCGDSFCDECMRSALLESDDHECPNCHASECSPDNLVPNKFLRTAVVNFLNDTGYTSVKKKRQPVSVAQPQVQQQRPPTQPMQVKPPPVQPVVQNPPHVQAPPVVAQAPPVVAQTMPMAPQPGTTVMVPQPASVAPGNGIPQSQVGLPVSAAHQMAHQQVNAIPSSIPPGQYATQQYAPRPMVGGPQMNGMPVPPQVHPAYRMSHPMGDPRGAAPPHVHPPGAFPRHPGYPSRPPGPMMRPPHIPPGVRPPPGMQPGMPPQMLGMPPNGPPNLIPVVGGPPMSKEEFYMEKSRLLQKKLEAEKKKKPVDPMDDFARELLEYKSQQKKRLRSRSRSRSMTPRSRSWTRSPSRSRSKRPRSRTKSRSKSRSRTPKASKPRSRTRSRSRSPVRRRPPSRSPPARKRSRSRSPPPYRRSPGPYRPRSRSPYGGRRSRSPFYREYPPGDRYRSPPPPFYPRPHEFEDPRYRGPPPPAPRMDDFYSRYEEPRFDPRYPQDEYYRDYYPRYPPHGRSRSPPPFPPPGPPEGWLRGRSPQPPPGTSPSRRRSREREPRSPGRERRSPGGGAVNKDRDSRRRSRSKERKSKDEERKKRSRSKDRASSEKSKREKTKLDSRSKENGPEKKSNTGSTKAEEPKKVRDKSSTSRSSSTSKKLSSSNENGKEKSAEVKKPEVEGSADKKKKRKEKTDKSVEPSKKKVKTEEGEAKKKSKTKVKKKKTSASADSKTTDSEAEKKEKHKKKKVEAPITEAAPVVKAEATSSIDEGEKPGEGQLSQIEPREVKIKMEETSSSEIIDEFSTAAEPDFELLEPDADALLITAPEMSKWEREESGSDTNLTGSPKTKSAVELKRSLPKSVIESAEKVFAAKAPKAAVIPSVASAVHVHKPARRVYVEETGRKSEPSPERKVSSTVGTVGSTFQVTIKAPVTASSKTAPSEQSIGKVDLRHKLRINREKDKYKALETKVRADKERREKLESKSDTALTDRHSKSSHELKHSKSDTSVKRETDDVKKPSSRVLDRKESVIDESKFEPDYEDNESGNSEKESGSEDSDDEKASQTSSASSSDSEKKKKKKTSKHKKHKHHKKHKKHKKKHKKHKEKEEKREEKRK